MFGWGRESPRAGAPAIDEGYLSRLERHVGRDTLRELLADGLMEIGDRLERLADCAAADARRDALALGHDLAGLSGHLGLSALSRAAVEMNRAARATPERPMSELAGPVIEAGGQAEAALRAHLAEDRAAGGDAPSEGDRGGR